MDLNGCSNLPILVRRLVAPSERELAGVLRVMRLAFEHDPFVSALLAGNLSPERVDALNGCMVRGALVEGEGEVWVAEVEREEMNGVREVVGQALWFLPGYHFMSSERQREVVRWEELGRLLGEKQERWFLEYCLPRLGALFARCLPTPGDTIDDSYHLQIVSVLPEYHNHGVAGAVVAPVFERAVRTGRRVLGEATKAHNVKVYEHVGCKLLGVEEFWPLPENGGESFKLWAMELKPEALTVNPHWSKRKTRTPARTLAKL
ncbi:hypothetical protein CALVIDRAFT_562590 [Calocera viscosa TUFC12733]|uniref:N-acetyltransferase domain-containing protein n=1 Tax=Calocera viscosa (strain TUFC12733) TaxID=1330018 RepID=A0A167NGG4_CALVF|nr:hypothetical protein CALVIDRAFT_562590 [Calocera viscosa TUFC12733]